jgi:hypothetical protein
MQGHPIGTVSARHGDYWITEHFRRVWFFAPDLTRRSAEARVRGMHMLAFSLAIVQLHLLVASVYHKYAVACGIERRLLMLVLL